MGCALIGGDRPGDVGGREVDHVDVVCRGTGPACMMVGSAQVEVTPTRADAEYHDLAKIHLESPRVLRRCSSATA